MNLVKTQELDKKTRKPESQLSGTISCVSVIMFGLISGYLLDF